MATYVNDLRLKEIGTGESSGTWGTETNVNLELIGEALGYGTEGITTNADTHTTTVADGSTDPGRAMYIEYTGTLDSACTITIAPNTLSRLHYIENGTSGSQNIIIKQGSGATVTIPPGDTKAVYLDGAGSGAKVVDVFASFSVVDLKVQDDLTVTDDATVGGTLGVTGILTCTDDIIIGDGKTIGSASDVDAMTIAANGQVTFTQTLIGTALDISGDIDVDGTANLDIVDIDGATNIAAAVTMATNNKIQFRDDAIHISSTADGQLDLVADTEIQIAATTIDINGAINASGEIIAASLDISGNIDVDGTTNLDVVDIDGAVDMASTLGVTGVVTANAGVVVDNITIDGQEIDVSSGDLTLDVAGNIFFNADGSLVVFADGAVEYGRVGNSSSDFAIQSLVQDKDIVFKGNDNGTIITALALDMSDAGRATFNNKASFNNAIAVGQSTFSGGSILADFHGSGSGVGAQLAFANDHNTSKFYVGIEGNTSGDGFLYQQQDADINFYTNNTLHAKLHNDGAFVTTPTAGGHAVFNENSVDADFRVESNNNANMLIVDGGSDFVGIGNTTDFGGALNVNGGLNSKHAVFTSTNARGIALSTASRSGQNDGVAIIDAQDTEGVGGFLELHTMGAERASFSRDEIVFNEGSNDQDFRVESNGNQQMLHVDGGNNSVGIGLQGQSGVQFYVDAPGSVHAAVFRNDSAAFAPIIADNQAASGTRFFISFRLDNTIVGNITSTGSSTVYATSSDYRLKENVDYTWDATTRLKQLKPARFNFIADETNTLVDGFLAHEVSSIVPEAISGEKDAVDADGNPDHQGIDQSKLVPLLVKTIQELETRITALES